MNELYKMFFERYTVIKEHQETEPEWDELNPDPDYDVKWIEYCDEQDKLWDDFSSLYDHILDTQ